MKYQGNTCYRRQNSIGAEARKDGTNFPGNGIISSYGDDRQQRGEVVENLGGNQEQQHKDSNSRQQIDQVMEVVKQVVF